ncbi:efflux RND transporter periplasmic adaptor subunit [Roseofilum casamattae]|uniref:Efflux RND transporter periplasmic adaptor subunit n=1 Tax=Roseofilum casamattae BLCC-M143 TaxID=3022442 RepID=A0ABT7BSI0_9CYAN|nr:efflux RND transporter periplasmic adaptor subunit [Roseofilum casamattae]MDJ1182145.1 efflux RND transporter periplasmic adaptor subunit [Roseofilum casamattae BLCC-M143]
MNEREASGIDDPSEVFTDAEELFPDEIHTPAPAAPGRSERRGLLFVALGIGVVLGIGVSSLFQSSQTAPVQPATATQSEDPVQTVTLSTVKRTQIPRTFTATGTVEAYDLLPILPQISDLQIRQVLVDEGDWVEKGQLLVVLDDSVLQTQIGEAKADVQANQAMVQERQAAVGQAKSALEAALANQTEAEAGKEQAIASLAQAEAELEQAERELKRSQTLSDEGAISTQDVDNRRTAAQTAAEAVRVAQANVNSANARISSAKANVSSARAGISSAQANANTAVAQLNSQQARLAQLQTRLGQTQVKAPASGRISERNARVGDLASRENAMFRAINQGALELQATIPEMQLGQVRIGSEAMVTSDADSRIKLKGTIREIAPLVDAETRQATVKIDLPTSSLLRPGMFLTATLTSQTSQGLAVPAEAVLPQSDGRTIVYQVDEKNRAIAKTVEVGTTLPGKPPQIEVKQGLNFGDRIIVLGAGFIKEGDIVRIASEQSTVIQ